MPTPANPNINLNLVLDQVAKDKGIERSVLIATLEDAMKTAAKKHFGQERNLEAKYDAEKGVVELFQAITVVETITDPVQAVNQITLDEAHKKGMEVEPGDELVFQIFYRDEDAAEAKAQDDQYGDILRLKTFRRGFGRIAAQTAKQVILQRTRDAERENVFNEYKDRRNEIVTGIARRFERGNIIVDLGRAEAVLPVREQVPRETYRAGDRVQAYVLDVLRESKGPQIVLSRASVNLLTKLFEMEVPEIAEGIVVIEAAAREPGGRAKIAVSSRDSDVDPVGACVGMKGSRVQAVVQELRGEKIDIVPYDEDPARFVCAALAPAEVSRVIIDEANHAMELIVPDDQLSLAIGRRGQNVRLAAQLTGWKLDINSESRVREMREFANRSLGALPGVNEMLVETLYAHGFRQAKDIAEANPEMLAPDSGDGPGAYSRHAGGGPQADVAGRGGAVAHGARARAGPPGRGPPSSGRAQSDGAAGARQGHGREDHRTAGPCRLQDGRGPGQREGPGEAGRRAGGWHQEGPPAQECGGELSGGGGEAPGGAQRRAGLLLLACR